jgi:hypothetical protein
MRRRFLWRIAIRCAASVASAVAFITASLYLQSRFFDLDKSLAESRFPVAGRTARYVSNDSSIRFEKIRDIEAPEAQGMHRTALAIDAFGKAYVSLDGSDIAIGPPTHVYSEHEPVWIAATRDSRLYYALPREGRLVVTQSNDSGLTFQSESLVFNGFRNIPPAIQGNLVSFEASSGGPATLYNVFLNQTRNEVRFARCIEPCLRFDTQPIFSSSLGANFDHPYPFIAVDRAQGIHCVFSDGQDVFIMSSVDNGETWKEVVRVNDPGSDASAPAVSPRIVAGDSGMLAVVWLQGERVRIAFTRNAFSAVPSFSSVELSGPVDNTFPPSVAVDPTGMVWVAFRNGNKLRILREAVGPRLFADALWSAVGDLSSEDGPRWLNVRVRNDLTGQLIYFDRRAALFLVADRFELKSKREDGISLTGRGTLQDGSPVTFSLVESRRADGFMELSLSMSNGYVATGVLTKPKDPERNIHTVTAGGIVMNAP